MWLVFVVVKDGVLGALRILWSLIRILTLGLFLTLWTFAGFLYRNMERFHARFFHLVAAIVPHQHEAINKLSLALHGTVYLLPRRATLFRAQILQDQNFIWALRNLRDEFPRDRHYYPTLPGDEEEESYLITKWLVDRTWRMAIQDSGPSTVELDTGSLGLLAATRNLAGARRSEWGNLRYARGRADALAMLETLARVLDIGFIIDPFIFVAGLQIFGFRLGVAHWLILSLSRIMMSGLWKEVAQGNIEWLDLWVMTFLLWWGYWSDLVSFIMFFHNALLLLGTVPGIVGRLPRLLRIFVATSFVMIVYIFTQQAPVFSS